MAPLLGINIKPRHKRLEVTPETRFALLCHFRFACLCCKEVDLINPCHWRRQHVQSLRSFLKAWLYYLLDIP